MVNPPIFIFNTKKTVSSVETVINRGTTQIAAFAACSAVSINTLSVNGERPFQLTVIRRTAQGWFTNCPFYCFASANNFL